MTRNSVVEVEYVHELGLHEEKTVNINPIIEDPVTLASARPLSAAFAAAGVPVLGRVTDEQSVNRSRETPLVALAVEELLTREIKPREMLLHPILPEQGLAMLYAYRGIGKTHLALGIAAAVASGTRFLRCTLRAAFR